MYGNSAENLSKQAYIGHGQYWEPDVLKYVYAFIVLLCIFEFKSHWRFRSHSRGESANYSLLILCKCINLMFWIWLYIGYSSTEYHFQQIRGIEIGFWDIILRTFLYLSDCIYGDLVLNGLSENGTCKQIPYLFMVEIAASSSFHTVQLDCTHTRHENMEFARNQRNSHGDIYIGNPFRYRVQHRIQQIFVRKDYCSRGLTWQITKSWNIPR